MKKRIYSCVIAVILISFTFLHWNTTILSAQESPSKSVSTNGEIASKEEVVYALLDPIGTVKQVYVVNILNVTSSGQITDYGSYSSLKNLTTTDTFVQTLDRITVPAPIGRFYYQGSLSDNRLPWTIIITYTLNGTTIDAEELPGKSGNLEINIHTERNSDLNPEFYDNYLLQVSITLDTSKCSNISAPEATLANAGSDKLITFPVIPGAEGELTINTEVKDFEMKGLEISAVPFSIDITLPDTAEYTDDLVLLSDAISELSDGINSISHGVAELNIGTERLKEGSSGFKTGLEEINSSSSELINASSEISDALTTVFRMLTEASDRSDLTSLTQLPGYLITISTGIEELAGGLKELSTNYSRAYSSLDTAIGSIPKTEITNEALQTLIMNNPMDTTVGLLVEYYTAARTIQGTYQMVSPVFEAMNTNLPVINTNLATISESLNTLAAQLTASFEKTDLLNSITQLSDGITLLSTNYEAFHNGIQSYTEGISQLCKAYGNLDNGISEIVDGTEELANGMEAMKDGATELDAQTTTMPEQLASTIDDLLAAYDTSAFTPVSFLSEKNDKVISVQFVFRTEDIIKPEITSEETDHDLTETFWSRLKALFIKKI